MDPLPDALLNPVNFVVGDRPAVKVEGGAACECVIA
jgi:hypothetical protein